MRRSLNFFFWLLFLSIFGLMVGGVWYVIHEHYAPVTLTLEQAVLVGPHDPLIIDFSQSMSPSSFDGKIALSPDIAVNIQWKMLDTQLVLTPKTAWPLATKFSLFIGQGETRYFAKNSLVSFRVTTPVYPTIAEVFPAAGAQDILLGIEDPLRVTFDRSVNDFYIDFRIDPKVSVVYQNNPEKTVFEILPQDTLLSNNTYTLRIFAKWKDAEDSAYHMLHESSFTTLPPAPVSWSGDLSLRTVEAKRFTKPRKSEGKYIDINLRSQVMTLFENGEAVDAYIVSSGKRGMDTPKGEFAIHNQALRPWSKKYSLYMPYWQAITPDGQFGIHELPEWPGGYKEGANHLGTPVSHGCVRLGIGPAKRVYEWATIGTPVVIY